MDEPPICPGAMQGNGDVRDVRSAAVGAPIVVAAAAHAERRNDEHAKGLDPRTTIRFTVTRVPPHQARISQDLSHGYGGTTDVPMRRRRL